MSFVVDIGHASARGPRALNEDFAGVVQAAPFEASRGLIAAVADGVSGGPEGSGQGLMAAQTTAMGLLNDFFATPATWETSVALNRLISAQNAWLAHHNQRQQGAGALTTLTALALQGQRWTLAHVGDTRAWLLRSQDGAIELEQLTHDHAFEHPDQRSRLSRAIGLDASVSIDFRQGEVQVGDTFVLSTDGVHGVLRMPRLAELVASADSAQAASDALVQAALQAGGQDNASALVIRVLGVDARELIDERLALQRLPAPPLLKVGEQLDGFLITAKVADTGVHLLYQAREPGSQALVALKTLHPSRAHDAEERALLAHESWLGQRLTEGDSRGFVAARPRPVQASALYIVFDWHAGQTLSQMMKRQPHAALADAVPAATAWAQALARLHRQGVIHRDIKPDNLHLGDDGQWRVLDLGAALSGQESAAQRELHAGTPSYMNPEQWEAGGQADAGSDLFALAVTLYQWLTGRLPFGEIEPYQLGRYRREPASVSSLRPDVPIWLDNIVRKALARDAAERFETAEELLLALERGASRPLSTPPATPLLQRDPQALLKLSFGLSLLLNLLLLVWLLFLPR